MIGRLPPIVWLLLGVGFVVHADGLRGVELAGGTLLFAIGLAFAITNDVEEEP